MSVESCARSAKPMRILAAIIGATVAFGALTGSAAAAPVVHENTANFSAQTFKTECAEDRGRTVCTDTSVAVFASDGTAEACLSTFNYEISRQGEFTPIGGKFGCGPVAAGAFTFDAKSLSGATLSSSTITVEIIACDRNGTCQPTGDTDTATLAATFTGTGAVSSFRQNSKSEFGNCTTYFVGKGSSRNADASVTIDGQPLDPPAMLFASTQKFKVICH
jgi:hypothetical protein